MQKSVPPPRKKHEELLDILFVLDTTGSMERMLSSCQTAITGIIKKYMDSNQKKDKQ